MNIFLIRGGSLYDRLVMNAIRSTTVRRRLVLVCVCVLILYFSFCKTIVITYCNNFFDAIAAFFLANFKWREDKSANQQKLLWFIVVGWRMCVADFIIFIDVMHFLFAHKSIDRSIDRSWSDFTILNLKHYTFKIILKLDISKMKNAWYSKRMHV